MATGLLCHLDDACISNPCQKGSNCDTNPVNGKAICTCPPGYTGSACNLDIDECSLGMLLSYQFVSFSLDYNPLMILIRCS